MSLRWLSFGLLTTAGTGLLALTSILHSAFAFGDDTALVMGPSRGHGADPVCTLGRCTHTRVGADLRLVTDLRLQHELAEHTSVGQGLQCGTSVRKRIALRRWRFQTQRHQLAQTPGEQRRRAGHLM